MSDSKTNAPNFGFNRLSHRAQKNLQQLQKINPNIGFNDAKKQPISKSSSWPKGALGDLHERLEKLTQASPVSKFGATSPVSRNNLYNSPTPNKLSKNATSIYEVRQSVEKQTPVKETPSFIVENENIDANIAVNEQYFESMEILPNESHTMDTIVDDIAHEVARPTAVVNPPNDLALNNYPEQSSMCFTLEDGRVTSVLFTSDGQYCIAAFSSGAIRLFDISQEGTIDPEDRFGHQIGQIAGSANNNSYILNMQMGEYEYDHTETTQNTRNAVKCSHLFISSVSGSNMMIVIDMNSLRYLKNKRGFFVGLNAGGIQVFTHSDPKLKGLITLSTIHDSVETTTYANNNTNSSIKDSFSAADGVANNDNNSNSIISNSSNDQFMELQEYQVKYRIITGKGSGSFHVWDVILTAKFNVNNNNMNNSILERELAYSQQWINVASGTVNGPSISFAHFVLNNNARANNAASAKYYYQPHLVDNNNNNSVEIVNNSDKLSNEIIAITSDKELRYCTCIDTMSLITEDLGLALGAKYYNVKSLFNVHASSASGHILFSGKDELIVTYYEGYGIVKSRFTFPLISATTKKSSRQCRQIQSIQCVNNGHYALIVCTDQSLLLYSPNDIFKKGFPGVSSSNNSQNTTGEIINSGYLTFLCQIDENYRIQANLSLVHSSTDDDNSLSHSSASAAYLLIALSWWNHTESQINRYGVLKTCKIPLVTSDNNNNDMETMIKSLLPSDVAIDFIDPSYLSEVKNNKKNKDKKRKKGNDRTVLDTCCLVCGDCEIKHWKDEDVIIHNDDDDDEDSGNDNNNKLGEDKPRKTSTNHRNSNNNNRKSLSYDEDIDTIATSTVNDDNDDNDDEEEISDEEGNMVKKTKKSTSNNSNKRKSTGNNNITNESKQNKKQKNSSSSNPSSQTSNSNNHNNNNNNSNNNNNDNEDTTPASLSLITYNQQLIEENIQLRHDLGRVSKEMLAGMRKADRRFENEKEVRKRFNMEQQESQKKINTLEYELQIKEYQIEMLKKKFNQLGASMQLFGQQIKNFDYDSSSSIISNNNSNNLIDNNNSNNIMSLLLSPERILNQFNNNNNNNNNNNSNSNAVQTHQQHTPQPQIRAFLCIVCQDYKADVILMRCGHICLCWQHATQWDAKGTLRTCPLCKINVDSYHHVKGIERIN